MGGWRIVVLCLALAAAVPVPDSALAQGATIMLPNNLARDGDLANEAFRHDRAVAHIHQNQRQIEYAHKQRLKDIQDNDRISGDEKAKEIADENQRFGNEMRGQERALAIAEQEHAQREAAIRAKYPEPGDREQIADRFNAEGSMLDRARAVADEDIRYESAAAHVDENRRAREVAHKQRLKDIEANRSDGDAKALQRAEEDELFETDMRSLDRQRKLVDEEHENRRAAIDARYGNPNQGDVFASQSDPTPPPQPGPAQVDIAPIEGGVAGGRNRGGRAVSGPGGRPPLQGGTQQTGTGGVGQPRPASRPPLLKGGVEENVGFPPQPAAPDPPPCNKEFDESVPTDTRFMVGLSDQLARCFETDVALLPVAPLAVAASKIRFVNMVIAAATRAQGAATLLNDLKKQRPKDECAYDTGVWYAQVLCDARMLSPSPGGRKETLPSAQDERIPFPQRMPNVANETPAPTPQGGSPPPSQQTSAPKSAAQQADSTRQRADAAARARAEQQRVQAQQDQQQAKAGEQQRAQQEQRARAEQQAQDRARADAEQRARAQQQAQDQRRAAEEQRTRAQQQAQQQANADPGRPPDRTQTDGQRQQQQRQAERRNAQGPDAPLQGGVAQKVPVAAGPPSRAPETSQNANSPRAANDNKPPGDDPLSQILGGYGKSQGGSSTGSAASSGPGRRTGQTPSSAPTPPRAPEGFEMSPYGDLTADELEKLKKAAAQAGFPVDVVGSVAKGRRRFGNGPVGKGEDQSSDLDILLHPDADLQTGGRASEAVYAQFPKGEKVDTIIVGEPRKDTPRIRIEPNGTVTTYGDVPVRKN
jgi:hypothetical protein